MMNFFALPRAVLCLLAAVLPILTPLVSAQVVPTVNVYHNQDEAGGTTVHFGAGEYGDEIRLLSGEARKLSDFTFDYFGDFSARLGVTAVLTFYKNDGADVDPGPKLIPGPGTLVYQSDPLLVQPGYHEVIVSALAIDVPGSFTWTVKFNGLSGVEGDRAGLLLQNPPIIGQSFDDFWQRLPDGSWQLFRLGASAVANFSARARAFAAPISFPVLENLSTTSGTPTGVISYKLDSITPEPGVITIVAKSDNEALVPVAGIVLGGTGLDRTLQINPVQGQTGIATIELLLTTSSGLTAKTSFRIRITGADSPILFTAIPSQKVAEGQATEKLPFEITGLKEEGGLVGAKVSSSNKELVADGGIVVGGDFGSYKLNVQVFPKPGKQGETTITLDVTAASGAKGSTRFKVTVGDAGPTPPAPPAASIRLGGHAAEPRQNGSAILTVQGQIPSEGLTVNYRVTGNATGGADYLALPGSILVAAPASGDLASVEIPIVVLDDTSLESLESLTLTILASPHYTIGSSSATTVEIADNDLPEPAPLIITGQPRPIVATLGGTAVFEVAATGNEPIRYQWKIGKIPLTDDAGVGIQGARSPRLTVSPIQSFHLSTYSVEVSDRTGFVTSDVVRLTLDSPNHPPVATRAIPDQQATEGAPFTFTLDPAVFSDPDAGDALSLNVSDLPSWLVFNAAEGSFKGTPSKTDRSSSTIRVVASDKAGALAESSFQIRVRRANTAPTISAIPDQKTTPGLPTKEIDFQIADAESPASELKLDVSIGEGDILSKTGVSIRGEAGPRTLKLSPEADKAGSVLVNLKVSDPQGASASVSFRFIVAAKSPPAELFVHALHRVVLGRPADAGELARFLELLSRTTPRAVVASFVLDSREFAQRWTDLAFERFLSRPPSASESLLFTELLRIRHDEELAMTALLSSEEYLSNAGGEHGSLLERVFRDLFHREIRPEEKTEWLKRAGESSSRVEWMTLLIRGTESRERFVESLFAAYLRRKPTVSELEDTAKTVAGLSGPNNARSALLGSEEFFDLAGSTIGNTVPLAASYSANLRGGGSIRLRLLADDPDGDKLRFTIVSPPAHGTLSGDAPFLVYLPREGFFGEDIFEYTAEDGSSTSAPARVTLNIGAPNRSPTLDPIADVELIEGSIPDPIEIKAADAETPREKLRFSATASDPAIFPPGSMQVLRAGSSFQLVAPVPRASSLSGVTVIVTVQDEDGLSSERTFKLVVRPAPKALAMSLPIAIRIAAGHAGEPFAVTATSPTVLASKLRLNVESMHPDLIPVSRIEITGEGGIWSVLILPPRSPGIAVLHFTATDGVASATQALTVLISEEGPEIVAQPESLARLPGQSATFRVEAKGDNLAYQWRLNRIAIPGATARRWEIGAVSALHEGRYDVLVSNGGGTVASLSASLRILQPPVLFAQPSSQTVEEGNRVAFSVSAVGERPLTYQWFKDRSPMRGETRRELVIEAARTLDAGRFFCEVTGGGVNTASAEAVLSVLPALRFSREPEGIEIEPGGAAIFSASVEGAREPVFAWMKNRAVFAGNPASTLEIRNATIEDSGSYVLVVRDGSRAIASRPAILSVKAPTLQLSESFAKRLAIGGSTGIGRGTPGAEPAEPDEPSGARAGIWAEWTAPQPGVVTFSTAGSAIPTSLDLFEGETLLTLKRLASDRGFGNGKAAISVVAGARVQVRVDGVAESSASRVVLGWTMASTPAPPAIAAQPVSSFITIDSLSPPRFSASEIVVEAVNPSGPVAELVYQWMKGVPAAGTLIEGATSPKLAITRPGSYYCRVSNLAGSVNSAVAVVVARTPRSALLPAQVRARSSVGLQNFADDPTSSSAAENAESGTLATDTFGATSNPGELAHCGVAGGASFWFEYLAPLSGMLRVNTEGSDFDTVLAAYVGDPSDLSHLAPLACDNNGGTDGKTSKMEFSVEGGKRYLVACDGVGGATGLLFAHYELTPVLSIDVVPVQTLSVNGASVVIPITISGVGKSPVSLSAVSGNVSLVPTSGLNVTGSGTNRSLAIRSGQDAVGTTTVTLIATDGASTAVREVEILVTNLSIPPRITPIPPQILVPGLESAPLVFSILDDDTPPDALKVTVAADPANLLAPDGIRLVHSGTLYRLSLTASNGASGSGHISVTVRDETDAPATTRFQVAVQSLAGSPRILSQPSASTVSVKGTAEFRVEGAGSPPLGYQWLFKGLPLSNATNATLILPSIGLQNAGDYFVVVSNALGSVTSALAALEVSSAETAAPVRLEGAFNAGTFSVLSDHIAPGLYTLESTDDFERWETLGTFRADHGFVAFSDTQAGTHGRRFYRIKKAP